MEIATVPRSSGTIPYHQEEGWEIGVGRGMVNVDVGCHRL